MREQPLSPVEALRLELRSKAGLGGSKPSDSAAQSTRPRGVEYFPSRLECFPSTSCVTTENDDKALAGGSPRRRQHQEQGPRDDSDLGALKAKLLDVQRREQDILGAVGEPPSVSRPGGGAMVLSQRDAAACRSSSPDGTGRKGRARLPADRRQRPSSSGPSRRPPKGSNVDEFSSRRRAGDYVECPSGCGEEVRVNDVGHHQASLCSLRSANTCQYGRGHVHVEAIEEIARITGIPVTTLVFHVSPQVRQLFDARMPGACSGALAPSTFETRLCEEKRAPNPRRQGQEAR